MFKATGVSVSGATVCRVLQQNGYTRKKIVNIARQRYRGAFMAHMLNFPVYFCIWLDETGKDHKDHIRNLVTKFEGIHQSTTAFFIKASESRL